MRLPVGVAGVLLLLGACSPSADPPPPTSSTLPDGPIRGVLPDGTVYDVILQPDAHEPVTGVTAGVVEDGEVTEVTFRRTGDGWATEPALPLTTHLGLPTAELPGGSAWAPDEQVPMEVSYRTFAVRRGCDAEAVACNPTEAVQVLARDGWSAEEATVVSYALRRPSHPAYLDPGPLEGQNGHDVVWTGAEMIVWGGTAPPRVAGAAYDPASDTWRTLPPAPLEEGRPTRGVWADDSMIVLAEEATVAYRPATDSWVHLGEGIPPPSTPDRVAWTGERLVVWTSQGIRTFDGGTWREIDDPGFGEGVFLAGDGRLLGVGPEECSQRVISELTGGRWREMARFPAPEEGCPAPHQSAVVDGKVVTWQDRDHPTRLYDPESDRWEEAEPIPHAAVDRPSGALRLDGRLLVARGGEGAIFEPATGEWQSVDLPGYGSDETMVWTGREVLMWSRCCYEPDDVDAWRWVPHGE